MLEVCSKNPFFSLPKVRKNENKTYYNLSINTQKKPIAKISINDISTYFPNISFKGNKQVIDTKRICELDIPNIRCANKSGVRGESLSHKRNRKFIPLMKEAGVKQVIDLKTADHSSNFKELVENNGLKYSHFPMDSENTTDEQIIEYLPEFFKAINDGDFYIACAQGMHRTDIALTVNYFFNKDAEQEPPILHGHQSKNGVRYSDIFRRTNSIFKSLTPESRAILGLEDFDEKKYKEKKSQLVQINDEYNRSFVQS